MLKGLVRPVVGGWLLCGVGGTLANAQFIEEVVVTAQKREQSLQETPIAISAFDADFVDKKDMRDLSALNGLAPNLRMASSPGNSSGATINIRGSVTTNPALTLEPTVGIYLDGIYIGKNIGGLFDVADLARVEVLRGPQGTLYGKNTLGGAINLIAKRPTGELGGSVKFTAGSDRLRSVKTALDLPALGEVGEGPGRVSAQLSYIATRRDGFIDNVASTEPGALPPAGRDFDNLDRRSGRVALLWQPVDAVDVHYAYDFSRIEQRPQMFQLTRLDQAQVDLYTQLAGLPRYDLRPFESSKRLSQASQNAAQQDDADVSGHGLELAWNAGEFGALGEVTLKSLSGYRELEALAYVDWDGSPFPLLNTGRDVDYRAKSQEFQWVGETERLNYVVGLYYFQERGQTTDPLDLSLYPAQLAPGVFAPSPYIISRYSLDNDATAIFSQFEWMPPVLDDRLRLTLGGRYTREKKSITRFYQIPAFGAPLIDNADFDEDYGNFSPTFVVAYQPSYDVNIYGKIARGWKAGVFNAESSDLQELDSPIDPESVTSFELGMKSRWWQDRLQLNAALFYNRHKDMQISRFRQDDAQSVFSNAGAATVRGLELELVAIPVENLQLTVGYGYTDPEYRKYMDECRLTATGANPCPAGVATGQLYDARDVNRFPYTAEHAGNIAVEYTLPWQLPGGGELLALLDWSYTDGYATYPDPYNYENTSVRSHDLLDARLTWGRIALGGDTELAVSVWGKNLLDESYRVNGIEWGPFTTMRFGDPRSAGVDATVKF